MQKDTDNFFSLTAEEGVSRSDPGAFMPDGDVTSVDLYPVEELVSMDRDRLITHVIHLQQVCGQLENDNRFLGWEFREFQDSLLCFSRAARLAHQLNAADMETISALAIDELPGYFNCRFAALYFYDDEKKILSLRRSSVACPEDAPLRREEAGDHFLFRMFLDHSIPFIASSDREKINAVESADVPEQIPEEWAEVLGKEALVFPLAVKQAGWNKPLLLGGLIIGDAKTELCSKDMEIAAIFADLFSSSLYNAMLVKKLNDMTIIDPLTQIYNRRYLISQLTSAMTQSRRQHFELSLIMLDIDNFKRFNDTYGHLCGDEVLRQIARLLHKAVRADVDIPARYGGEEFVIVMPYCGIEQATTVANRIRDSIRSRSFEFEDRKLAVTCSFGVAGCLTADTVDSFIDRADIALYQAKRDGRDQVAVAPSRPLTRSRRMVTASHRREGTEH